MRRTRLLVVVPALALAASVVVACDTDDGRDMRPPTSDQRAEFAATTTTSTTTTTLFAPVTEAPTTLATTLATGSEAPVASGDAAGAAAGAVTTVAGSEAAAPLEAPWADGAAIDAAYTCDGSEQTPLIRWTAPPTGTELALVVTDDDADGYVHWIVTGLAATAGAIGGTEPPAGVVQPNDGGAASWAGPCPPVGETHTYRLALYSLAAPYVADPADSPATMVGDLGGAAVDVVELTGTYQRAG